MRTTVSRALAISVSIEHELHVPGRSGHPDFPYQRFDKQFKQQWRAGPVGRQQSSANIVNERLAKFMKGLVTVNLVVDLGEPVKLSAHEQHGIKTVISLPPVQELAALQLFSSFFLPCTLPRTWRPRIGR